ncbi:MAG: LysR family transcriptional regulator [Myxococcales bacterium]|nr:LysR family transcriptional regulator [Myxococcales bacterium]
MSELGEINLNLLVALSALLEEVNVTRAAARLGVTQSAMSHNLRQLRAHFGDRLLVRGPRGMLLTAQAEALRGPLRRGLAELERVVRGQLRWAPAEEARVFRVAVGDFVSLRVLPPLIERLRREAPRVDVVIRRDDLREGPAQLETGELDVLVAYNLGDAPGLRQRALLRDGFSCLARVGHPAIRGPGDLDLDRYCALSHVLIAPRGESGSFVETALERLGRRRRVALRVPYFLVAPLVVARSDLLLTAPTQLAEELAAHYPLQVLPAPIELPMFTLHLIWHERFDDDPGHRWLRDALAQIGAGP